MYNRLILPVSRRGRNVARAFSLSMMDPPLLPNTLRSGAELSSRGLMASANLLSNASYFGRFFANKNNTVNTNCEKLVGINYDINI